MKGSDLLPISTYDSWTLLRNPDLIFLTSSNIDETNTADYTNSIHRSVYGGKYGQGSRVSHEYAKHYELCQSTGKYSKCFLFLGLKTNF